MLDRLFEWHPIGQDKILDNLVKNITDKIENSRKSLKNITKETRENENKIATHLINALYISNFSFPASAVSINLTAKNYSGKQYGYKNVIKVYDAIQLLKLKLTQRHHIGDRESEHRRCCAPSSQQRSQA
mgnify:CR=1 FL=1